MGKQLKGKQVRSSHNDRRWRIRGIASESAAESLFVDHTERHVSVAEYFARHYGIVLAMPHLPCLKVPPASIPPHPSPHPLHDASVRASGWCALLTHPAAHSGVPPPPSQVGREFDPVEIPMELCHFLPGQAKRDLTIEHKVAMIKETCAPPQQRHDTLRQIVANIHANDRVSRSFGVDVDAGGLSSLTGRILDPLQLMYKDVNGGRRPHRHRHRRHCPHHRHHLQFLPCPLTPLTPHPPSSCTLILRPPPSSHPSLRLRRRRQPRRVQGALEHARARQRSPDGAGRRARRQLGRRLLLPVDVRRRALRAHAPSHPRTLAPSLACSPR